MTALNTCQLLGSRLLAIRVGAGYRTVDDVDHMIRMIREAIARVPSAQQAVVAADWRPCTVMTPETADRAHVMLSANNPRVARSGILTLPDQPTAVLQVMRLVRESHHPQRRMFTSPPEMLAWLAEVLEPAERALLEAHFAE
jgi:hypothetical protein